MSFVDIFKRDLSANNASWHDRSFWFFLFLRGAQHFNFAQFVLLCKLEKKIVVAGTSCELPTFSFKATSQKLGRCV